MMIAMLACFFLALLSKESAIVFVALVPLFLHFFTKTPLKKTLQISGATLTVALLYITLHLKIIGSIGIKIIPVIDNSLLQSTSFFEQKATAIYILGKYLLLLIFPYPLSSDYSFNTIPMVTTFANFGFLLALVVHLYLLYFAVKKWKEKNILSFCILFYFITMALASNIFMLIGTHLAERLLFLPSVAFCLAFISLLSKLFKFDIYDLRSGFINVKNKSILFITGIVLILFVSKTFSRNKDWETDTTLFAKDMQTVPNSAHMLFYYANNLTSHNTLDTLAPQERETRLLKAQKSIDKALLLYDLFPDAHNVAGRIYYAQKNFQEAYKSYSRASEMSPENGMYHNNLGTSLFALGKFDDAAKEFQKATELNKYDSEAQCNLGSAFGAMGETYKNKGDILSATKMFTIAIENFKKATEINPNYKSAYQFVGLTYKNLGDTINGQIYLDKAARIKK
jgi:tetratricopeptide (TPR) repeat protein